MDELLYLVREVGIGAGIGIWTENCNPYRDELVYLVREVGIGPETGIWTGNCNAYRGQWDYMEAYAVSTQTQSNPTIFAVTRDGYC